MPEVPDVPRPSLLWKQLSPELKSSLQPGNEDAGGMWCNFPKAARARLVESAGLRLKPHLEQVLDELNLSPNIRPAHLPRLPFRIMCMAS